MSTETMEQNESENNEGKEKEIRGFNMLTSAKRTTNTRSVSITLYTVMETDLVFVILLADVMMTAL